ncbi:ceramidase [Photobacterium makurazakiensis]|uniref:ceramidase domain-containing protein n=1 Tax=Photobacterium makurazakiensis TaxID=2910234 RepID=UPI003D0D6222
MPSDNYNNNMRRNTFDWRYGLLVAIAIALAGLAFFFSPIHQSRNFYQYADQRVILAIPHFWNVISNSGFILVGVLGLHHTVRRIEHVPNHSIAYQLFFLSLIAAFAGSSAYHFSPNAFTLMLDRIPITIGFICLYCIVIAECISQELSKRMFPLLLAYGIISVIYWYMTDVSTGRGNMAAYVLVQVLPIIHIPLIILLYPSRYSHSRFYLYALGWYVLAKGAESNDEEIYQLLGETVSGHSIKHILAAIAGYCIYLGWKKRNKKPCHEAGQ